MARKGDLFRPVGRAIDFRVIKAWTDFGCAIVYGHSVDGRFATTTREIDCYFVGDVMFRTDARTGQCTFDFYLPEVRENA